MSFCTRTYATYLCCVCTELVAQASAMTNGFFTSQLPGNLGEAIGDDKGGGLIVFEVAVIGKWLKRAFLSIPVGY